MVVSTAMGQPDAPNQEKLAYCANLLMHFARMYRAHCANKRYNVDRIRRGGMVTFPLTDKSGTGAMICCDEEVADMCLAAILKCTSIIIPSRCSVSVVHHHGRKTWEITIAFTRL